MKQRFSFLHGNEIDFNQLSDFTVANYVENPQGPLISDDIIQMLINEAQDEGIVMRQFPPDETDDQYDSAAPAASLSFAPAIDRPMSTSSITSDR